MNGYMLAIMHTSHTDPRALAIKIEPFADGVEVIQSYVDGYFESLSAFYFPQLSFNVLGWCNEEGRLIGLPQTYPVVQGRKVIDVLVGNILIQQYEHGADRGYPFTASDAVQASLELKRYYDRFGIDVPIDLGTDPSMDLIQAYEKQK